MWGESPDPIAVRPAVLCGLTLSLFRLAIHITVALALLFISTSGPADVTYAPTRGGGARVFLSGHSPRRLGAPHFTAKVFISTPRTPDRR
jgi:hypothetical protein